MARRPADPTRRSERARRAIHAAARELVTELGYAGVSVEAIAARAGVGKQTIYRWWPSKAAVVLDAMVAEALPGDAAPPLPDTGDLLADLRAVLHGIVAELNDPATDNLLRAMVAEMQHDTAFAGEVVARLFAPQFASVVARIGADAGAVAAGDPVVTAELLLGPVLHRWLLRARPLTEGYADDLLGRVLSPR